jgi:hypothetical protein
MFAEKKPLIHVQIEYSYMQRLVLKTTAREWDLDVVLVGWIRSFIIVFLMIRANSRSRSKRLE